jgi:hypothetical protein
MIYVEPRSTCPDRIHGPEETLLAATAAAPVADDFLADIDEQAPAQTGVTYSLTMTAADQNGYGLNITAQGFTREEDVFAAERRISAQWEEEGVKARAGERYSSSPSPAPSASNGTDTGHPQGGGNKAEDDCDKCGTRKVEGWQIPGGDYLNSVQMARSARRKTGQALCPNCKFANKGR